MTFPRNFNRISGPDANSCAGCHNEPYVGGGGDHVTDVFVGARRFDFATFDHADTKPMRGAVDERTMFVTQGGQADAMDIGDERKTVGMFGSGFIEMLARQMTADLQAIRDATPRGKSSFLSARESASAPSLTRPMAHGTPQKSMDCRPAASLPAQNRHRRY